MTWNKRYTDNVAHMYGYKNRSHYGIEIGDEVLVLNRSGAPVCNDMVEAITSEAVCVGGQWWYDFEYTVRKLNG